MSAAWIDVVRDGWRARRNEVEDRFGRLWARPELPMMEVRAARELGDWLAGHGFRLERGLCGIPTAFRASYGCGEGPAVGLLAEYDALPGQANQAVPRRARADAAAGHACTHNQIGPANAGAAIAARYAMEALGIGGRIVVLGCPAEEIVWGKVALLDRGGFDGLDALLTSHGDYQTGALSRPCQAVVTGEFLFRGQAGHTGSPRRRNALETVELAVQSFERLRAHEVPEAAIEHVVRTGGLIPNITPEEARMWVATRHVDYDRAREAYDYVTRVVRHAAAFTEVGVEELLIAATRGYLPNDVLARLVHRNMERVGPPAWTAEDIAWMTELAAACRPGEPMALDRGIGFYDQGIDPYGQDDGEASWRIPLGRANWALPRQVPLHHWATTALAGHRASWPGPLMVSESLALATVELLSRPELVAEAAAELRDRRGPEEPSPPHYGGFELLTTSPARFWGADWDGAGPLGP